MSANEMVVQEQHQIDRPATAIEIRKQVNLVQEVMQAVMKQDVHYGIVPGCGKKPTLLKAGAEKLLSTFRIAVTPEVEDLSTSDECRYRVRAIGATPNGLHVGTGIGECSSKEEKYMWREAVCQAEFDDTDETRRRIKYKKFNNERVQQVRVNHADVANTVLKMAKKRALIDLTLTATAASDCFTQDIEDMPEEMRGPVQPQIKQPQRRATPQEANRNPEPDASHNPNAPTSQPGELALDADSVPTELAENEIRVGISSIKQVTGTNKKTGKAWILYAVQTEEGEFGTFDKKIADMAKLFEGKYAIITWKPGFKAGARDIEAIRQA